MRNGNSYLDAFGNSFLQAVPVFVSNLRDVLRGCHNVYLALCAPESGIELVSYCAPSLQRACKLPVLYDLEAVLEDLVKLLHYRRRLELRYPVRINNSVLLYLLFNTIQGFMRRDCNIFQRFCVLRNHKSLVSQAF